MGNETFYEDGLTNSRNGCIDLRCVRSVQTSPNVSNRFLRRFFVFLFFTEWEGEGGYKKRRPWSNLLIIEDHVVFFYKSEVDIAVSSYL